MGISKCTSTLPALLQLPCPESWCGLSAGVLRRGALLGWPAHLGQPQRDAVLSNKFQSFTTADDTGTVGIVGAAIGAAGAVGTAAASSAYGACTATSAVGSAACSAVGASGTSCFLPLRVITSFF